MRVRDSGVSWLVVSLLIAGCGSGDGTSDSPTSTSDTTIGDTSTGGTQPIASDVPIGPGSFFLIDPGIGLDALSGYTATMTVSFQGTRDGQPQSWSNAYTLRYSQDPPARQLTIESSGDVPGDEVVPPGGSVVLFAEAAGATFQVRENGTCAVGSVEPTVVSAIDSRGPVGMLPALLGAEEAGEETVDGVATDHYTFDQRALVQAAAAEGEVWVASDGGPVVRFIVTTTGDAEYFGEGVAGSITSEYLLSEINGQPDVVLPLVCLDGVLDIPLLQASNLVRAARDALSYQTEVSVTDAVDFYLEGMPDEGWTLLGETTVGAFVILRFSRDDRGLFVIVSDDAGVTRIDAVLGSLPSL